MAVPGKSIILRGRYAGSIPLFRAGKTPFQAVKTRHGRRDFGIFDRCTGTFVLVEVPSRTLHQYPGKGPIFLV
jgi:hypothetical protein